MLSRIDLERLAETISHGNVGHAEKLYLQDIILLSISRETVDELVFKGGTALLKCYQLDRFSEDLDFTAHQEIDLTSILEAVIRDLENYGAAVADRTSEESTHAIHIRLGIEGPLYTGDRRSLCFIRLEINTRSSVLRPNVQRYTPPFPDIPSFDLALLAEEEIFAEKIRAILTRQQPRDLYDCYHLLSKGVEPDRDLIQEKLDYYDLVYEPDAVFDAAREVETNWRDLDALTYSALPPFEVAFAALETALGGSL